MSSTLWLAFQSGSWKAHLFLFCSDEDIKVQKPPWFLVHRVSKCDPAEGSQLVHCELESTDQALGFYWIIVSILEVLPSSLSDSSITGSELLLLFISENVKLSLILSS